VGGSVALASPIVATPRRRRPRRTWPQRLVLTLNLVLILGCLGAAGAFSYVRQKASEIAVVEIGGVAKPAAELGQPRNILLIGTDSAAGLDKKDPVRRGRDVGGQLADVIMILRVDPRTETAALLSIPRDTWVPVAPRWSESKINSSFSGGGGPATVIATIKHNFGISVDNYAQVDFAGFRGIVEVLGGVPVYLERPISDPTTGLWLIQTGCIVVDPPQALAYARSRHFRYQDRETYKKGVKWITDPTGDLGRITRQQQFLQNVAQQAISKGIRNPSTAMGLVNEALGSVQIDESLNVGQIVDLIQIFRNFDVGALQRYQLPTESGGNARNSYQEVRWAEAEGMLDVFRGVDDTVPVEPETVLVDVLGEEPSALVAELEAAGFDADGELGTSGSARGGSGGATTVRFGLRGVESARLLAAHLDVAVRFEYQGDLPGRRLQLVPGAAEVHLRARPLALDSIPVPTFPKPRGSATTTTTTTSTTTTTVGGSTTTADPDGGVGREGTATGNSPDVTTTTVVGIVPMDVDVTSRCG